MDINFFKEKFEAKTNEELEEIAKNNIKYVLTARFAAVSIMKNRNLSSQIIEIVEQELDHIKIENQVIKEFEQEKSRRILQHLVEIKKEVNYKLENGNELQVKRFHKRLFQIRIEHYKSFFSPVVLCLVNKNSELIFFPFFLLKVF